MTPRNEAYYRRIAEKALAVAGVAEPPVPIADIVASLGIPIVPVNLPQFFSAAIISEDGVPVIVSNFAKPEHERRRALAHLLGHVLLLQEDFQSGYPRQTTNHQEADIIAHELTMPMLMVIEQSRLWFNDYRYLARLFAVGEGAMLERMRELGIVENQQPVRWDY